MTNVTFIGWNEYECVYHYSLLHTFKLIWTWLKGIIVASFTCVVDVYMWIFVTFNFLFSSQIMTNCLKWNISMNIFYLQYFLFWLVEIDQFLQWAVCKQQSWWEALERFPPHWDDQVTAGGTALFSVRGRWCDFLLKTLLSLVD